MGQEEGREKRKDTVQHSVISSAERQTHRLPVSGMSNTVFTPYSLYVDPNLMDYGGEFLLFRSPSNRFMVKCRQCECAHCMRVLRTQGSALSAVHINCGRQ